MNISLDPYNIFFGMLFGIIGYGAWRYGRNTQSERHLILAILLMTFSYFVNTLWITLGLGSILTLLLFWP